MAASILPYALLSIFLGAVAYETAINRSSVGLLQFLTNEQLQHAHHDWHTEDNTMCLHDPPKEVIPSKEQLHRQIQKEQREDVKFSRAERKKRQASRTAYQQYLENLAKGDYDVRYEEGWQNILYPFGAWVLDETLMGQAGRETQTNLGFDCPYFGFRFNYTFVYPMGMIAFARPPFVAPPYTFPNPAWPKQNDHSFIAPFYADSMFQWIGNTKISNVFFRSVHRPRLDDDTFFDPYHPYGINPDTGVAYSAPNQNPQYNQYNYNQQQPYYAAGAQSSPNLNPLLAGNAYPGVGGPQSPVNYQPYYGAQPQGQIYRAKRQMPGRTSQPGMVIDPFLLDNITADIQEGYTGANGFRAEHAFIVTWYRMAYGGAPRALDVSQFDYVKDWQNTFQLVIATDEIRTFAIFNYARLNWTSSNEAGGLNGFGGKQAAMAGFNGGNGTGWWQLPYSGHGRVWKLGYFSNVLTPGRWVHRVDELILPAGCTNASHGSMLTAPPWGNMLGGMAINVSGPCFKPADVIKVSFESWVVDCTRISRVRARCIMPMFHKTGLVPIRLSHDGGASYPFNGWFYVVPPHFAPASVALKDAPANLTNRWASPTADQLSLGWQALNLTWNMQARVDINLYGYWEDADKSYFRKVDSLAKGIANSGSYTFRPTQLIRDYLIRDAWRKYHFGFVQVALTDTVDGVLWSKPTPFPWYHLPKWQSHYGDDWALDMCIEWFEYDGRRRNFQVELTQTIPCPCKMEQAKLDVGNFMPLFDCDMDGDNSCPDNKGAQHCVQSVNPSSTGASQQCCYDWHGFLMFTDDWEIDGDYTRFFQPGTPVRAHTFGGYPYLLPPFIPSMSHIQLDVLPYRTCCHYAQHCEFYYWRRMTNGCQGYKAPAAGYTYGDGAHFITFDGTRYTFPGKGYYVLAMSEDPNHKLMVQVRLEQPSDTLWHSHVNATVVTGVAIQENSSSIIQIFARKSMRRWRYKMDVYANGVRRFFDKPHWKLQVFNGVQLRNPLVNMDQSAVVVMLASGAAVYVQESNGMLDVQVILPASYNSTCRLGQNPATIQSNPSQRCYSTMGLLGTYDNDPTNDLLTLSGTVTRVQGDTHTASTTQMIYEQFGTQWRVDGKNDRIGALLFNEALKPLFNPLLFASPDYMPIFWPQYLDLNASRVFSMEEVVVACQGSPQCEYDYIVTGRKEVALTTLAKQKAFLTARKGGTKQLISCGPLTKMQGVIKTPASSNYLDGNTVEFSCKPNYLIHGDTHRTCINGTWSPGWWAWCRDRDLEYILKWMTALLSIFGIVLIIVILYCLLWLARREKQRRHFDEVADRERKPPPHYPFPTAGSIRQFFSFQRRSSAPFVSRTSYSSGQSVEKQRLSDNGGGGGGGLQTTALLQDERETAPRWMTSSTMSSPRALNFNGGTATLPPQTRPLFESSFI